MKKDKKAKNGQPVKKSRLSKKALVAIVSLIIALVATGITATYRYLDCDKQEDIRVYTRNGRTFLTMYHDKSTGLTATGVGNDQQLRLDKFAWVTAAHIFGPTIKKKEGGFIQRKKLFVTNIEYQGNDLATFNWGGQPKPIQVITNWVASQEYQTEVRMYLFDRPKTAFYLLDQKEYLFIGTAELTHPLTGEKATGFIITRESPIGDCGTGFLVKGQQLCIITKGMSKVTYQGKTMPATLCVPVGIN